MAVIKGTKMKISFVRSNSLGFAGTYRNALHHAKSLLPIIDRMVQDVQNWGFVEWVQGHNTHIFITKDDRKVILRPINDGTGKYVGISIELSKTRRCAAGQGLLVTNILVDDDLSYFSKLMAGLAMSVFENKEDKKDKEDKEDKEDREDVKNEEIPV